MVPYRSWLEFAGSREWCEVNPYEGVPFCVEATDVMKIILGVFRDPQLQVHVAHRKPGQILPSIESHESFLLRVHFRG
jgi:hypothetical protein